MATRAGRVSWATLSVALALLAVGSSAPQPARAYAVVGTGTPDGCTEAALNTALGCGAPSGSPPASSCAGGGNVTFNCGLSPVTITVTSTKAISADTTIDGGSLITISGGNSVGVFSVNSGVNFTVQNLTIANGYGGGIRNWGRLTVTNSTFSNNSAYYGNYGGAIFNGGTLTVTNSAFSGNSADFSGAISNASGGTLTVTNSTFSGNGSTRYYYAGSGGAIGNSGTLTVTNSTFSGNWAKGGAKTSEGDSGSGGAIDNRYGGTLTVTDSTFSGNTASTGSGGAIYNGGTLNVTISTFSDNSAYAGGGIDNEGTLTVTNTTFSGNTASGFSLGNYGGAIFNGGRLTVTNSTFSGNTASGSSLGNYGGAILNANLNAPLPGGTLTVINSTFSGNSAAEDSGGAVNNTATCGATGTAPCTAMLRNTIVANGRQGGNCSGTITDGGHNLDDGTTCGFSTANGSLSNTNPQLDPAGLANNGGPTQTIALKAGSPAINAGDESICATGPVWNLDQRSYKRPGTGSTNCSIGAYEFDSPGLGLPTPTDTPTPPPTPTPTLCPTFTPCSPGYFAECPFPGNYCGCTTQPCPGSCQPGYIRQCTGYCNCNCTCVSQTSPPIPTPTFCATPTPCAPGYFTECPEPVNYCGCTCQACPVTCPSGYIRLCTGSGGINQCDSVCTCVTPTPTQTAPNSPTGTNTPTPTPTETSAPTSTVVPCVGDCNNDGTVTVDEVLTMVNIALGTRPVDDCLAGDVNGDGQITVDEILTAVNNALNGCEGS